MAKSRSFSRYLFQYKHQKRYSFTKTKMLIGFFVSLFTSIFLGRYLEAHGKRIAIQAYQAFVGESEPIKTIEDNPQKQPLVPPAKRGGSIRF